MCDLAELGDVTAAKRVADRFLPALRGVEHSGGLDPSTLPRMIVQTQQRSDKAEAIDAEVIADEASTNKDDPLPRELRRRDTRRFICIR
jgi:hypothetical protein